MSPNIRNTLVPILFNYEISKIIIVTIVCNSNPVLDYINNIISYS